MNTLKPMKTHSSIRKVQNRRTGKGPLFLGLKLVGELRILMRLAAGAPSARAEDADNSSY